MMFRRGRTSTDSGDQARAMRASTDSAPQSVSWSDNPEEMDHYSPRTPRPQQHPLTESTLKEQNWLHQQRSSFPQPATPAQHATTAPEHVQSQCMPRQSPPTQRQPANFFAVSPPTHNTLQPQPSASSALSYGSSAGSGSLPAANFFAAQSPAASAVVFGKDFVGEVKEVFYMRERPTVPQSEDGFIRSPVAGGSRHELHDAFKIDYNGREMTLKDLPSKDPILFIKKRPLFAQYVIYTGGSVSGVATATVKKASSKKLSISLEGKGHVKYEAEGDFAEFVYSVSRSGDKVAQVLREDQARAAVTSKHAYSVHVAAHTDCALILAIAMIAEEMGREKDLHLMSRAGSH